jgi:DNA (cytosine-5)-methyltransferase 1
MLNGQKLKFIDLFAGIGGFRLALESLGLKCVFSSELNKYAQETYSANFGKTPHGDITKIASKIIPKHNILCAGFPCQAFSISGKRLGFDDVRGTLFFEIARIAKHHNPKILFLENVKNFVRHDKGKSLKTVREILKSLNYDVFYKVLNASNFGVPTARERIYILGFRRDLNISNFEFPKSKPQSVSLKQLLDNEELTSKYIINRKDVFFKTKQINKNVFGEFPNKPVQIGIINKGGQGERIYHENGHAITFSANGGGVASKTGAYLVNGKIRKLTPRECARIMGFPEDFKIPVSDAQAYKQFGNTVAIPIIKAIFENILEIVND